MAGPRSGLKTSDQHPYVEQNNQDFGKNSDGIPARRGGLVFHTRTSRNLDMEQGDKISAIVSCQNFNIKGLHHGFIHTCYMYWRTHLKFCPNKTGDQVQTLKKIAKATQASTSFHGRL